MRFKFLSLVIVFFMIFVSINALLPIVKSSDNEIYVDSSYIGYSDGTAEKPYDTIEEALKNADEGDTIYLFSGIYQEDLKIDKKVKIIGGIDEEETIIDTRFDRRYMIEIVADEVTIEGITFSDEDSSMSSPIGALMAISSNNNRIVRNQFKNTSSYGIYIDPSSNDNLIHGNTIGHTKAGVYISSSNTNDLADNKIHNSTEYGIYMKSSGGNNRLYNNRIYDCPEGISIEYSNNLNITSNMIVGSEHHAIYVSKCQIGSIIENILKNGKGDGIYLGSDNFYIRNNTITDLQRGIEIAGSGSIIFNNTLTELTASGVYIHSYNDDNLLYLNILKNNGVSAKDQGDNQWYYQLQGNYWSDYNNADEDFDGIGDEPYTKNGVLDEYPLGYFLKSPFEPTNPSPEDFETDVGLHITLKVHVEDPDSDELTVYFYRGDDDTLIESTTKNPVERVQNNSKAQIEFTLGFDTVFTWYAIVDDGKLQNRSKPFIFYTKATPPDNEPPVPSAGGPYFVEINETVEFTSAGSYDPDGEIVFYRWNFGDGSSEILKENPTHKYLSPMEYQVTLTVIDNSGSSSSVKTFASVSTIYNDPPVAKIVIPEKEYVGKKIVFDSSDSYDPDDDNLFYTWDFGNGEFSNSPQPSFSYSSSGTYLVQLNISDGEYFDIDNATIKIVPKKSEGIPGFDFLTLCFSVIILIIVNRRRRLTK